MPHHHEMRTDHLTAVLHDCEGGLSGIRTLIHKDQGDNVLFPGLGGLNFEYIFDGIQPEGGASNPARPP